MSHKLTPKQYRAIRLLIKGASNIEVSKELKLRRETLSRWKKKPEFKQYFEKLMDERCQDMRHDLSRLVAESIQAVSYGMNSNYCEPQRIRAALSVLKMLGIERVLLQKKKKDSQYIRNKSPETLQIAPETLQHQPSMQLEEISRHQRTPLHPDENSPIRDA